MPRVQLETGQIIEFDNTPSQEDIEEVVGQINAKKSNIEQPKSRENILDVAVKKAGSLVGIPENIPVPSSKQIAENVSPELAGINQTARDVVTIPAHYFNQLMMNLPRSVVRTAGMEYPENAESPVAQTAAKVAGGVGALRNPLANTAARVAINAPLRTKAITGAITGSVYSPNDDVVGLKERAKQSVAGAIMSIGGPLLAKGALKVIKGVSEKNIKVDSLIDKAISKAIRPSVSGKMNSSQIENYYSKARQGVKTILNNKDNLQFFDEAGQPINKLPESLKDFSSAIEQTKNKLWSEIDSLAQQTEKQGVGINTNNVTNELNKITSNRMLRKLHPDVVQYAKKQIEAYNSLGKITPSEAQAEIKNLNDSLTSFYRNPSFDTARKAQIDALIANNLRKSLDDTITSFTGKQYQPLRNDYAALKTIESDVNRRAIIDARKNIKGLIDFSDIISGGDMAQGILSLNPSLFATGVVKKSIASYIKLINDPNNIIKNMFKTVNKLNMKSIPKTK